MGDESIPKKDSVRKPTRVQQIFLYIGPFPAMVSFKVWASSGRETDSLLAAACAMLAYCIFIVAAARRWDKPTYFDWTICGYFLVLVVSLALWPSATGAIVTEYAVTGIYICLFAAAFFPPVLGFEPFTYHYAKKFAPPEVWANPIFVTINRIMNFAWAGIFAVCMVLSLYPSVVTRALIPIALIFGAGVPFMLRFPDYYLKRLGLPSQAEMRKFMPRSAHEASSHKRNLVPRPYSLQTFMLIMAVGFNAERAADTKATLQFNFSGAVAGSCYFRIKNGKIEAKAGISEKPDLTVESPFDSWMDIMTGKADGQQMFMQQKYKPSGDLSLLMRMKDLFGNREN
ncbi:MAG: SCP2 sterol-binding domain-containing protein [Desulfomonilaceae bacterium]